MLAGRRANATRANRVILSTNLAGGRSYVVLSGPDGVLNGEGEYYYHLLGEHPPDRRFDYNQLPTQRGDSEFARDRAGREVRLRTLRPDGAYQYSALGKMFYRVRQVEHIVHIPVRIEGRRRDNRTYVREDYLPFDSLSVERVFSNGLLTEAQRLARVREVCLQALQIRTVRGRPVLLEISGETYFYDRTRPWRISSLTTTPHEGGQPTVTAALNRPMGALRSPSLCAARRAHPARGLGGARRQALCGAADGEATSALPNRHRRRVRQASAEGVADRGVDPKRREGLLPRALTPLFLRRQRPPGFVGAGRAQGERHSFRDLRWPRVLLQQHARRQRVAVEGPDYKLQSGRGPKSGPAQLRGRVAAAARV